MYRPTNLANKSNKKMMTDNPYVVVCADCHDWIRKNVAEYSMKNFNTHLCFTCQQERKAD